MSPAERDQLVRLFQHLLRRLEETLSPRLQQVTEQLNRMERVLGEVAADVDEIDRFNRPEGDGTKIRRRRSWR